MTMSKPPRFSPMPRAGLPVLLLLVAGAPALADGLSLNGAVELDDEGGYWISGGLAGGLGTATDWRVSVSRSEVEDNLSNLSTTAADAAVTHAFGPLAVGLGVRWWEDADVVSARVLRTSMTYEGTRGYAGVSAELRQSEFEPFTVATLIELANGTIVPVTASADCDLDDRGIGAHAGWFGDGWHLSGDYTGYDYDDADCTFGSPLLDSLRRARRDVFVEVAGRITTDLSRTAGFRVTADNAFLDHRWGVEAGIDRSAIGYWVRYDRAEEVFAGFRSETFTLGVTFVRASGAFIDVYAGTTDGDAFGSVAFLGLMVDLAL
jgi:hypothetical protein